jgi:protein-S-isoprenylcysteine O-methyltransferase Ste14
MALQEEFEQQGNWLFRYRSNLPLVIFLIGAIVYFYSIYDKSFVFFQSNFELYFQFICIIVGLFGLWIRIFTVGHTPKNTSGRNTQSQIADTLNTSGIYSIVRHPLYVGNFFMWLGPILLTANIWFIVAFILFYWIYYERIMFAEEQFLRRKFGENYTNWASSVPAFIPNFKKFRKPNLPFNWKKVLLKEKNGIAALFIIFTGMDIAGKLIAGRNDWNYVIIISCAISILYYLIVKILRKRSNLFKNLYGK